MKIFISYSHAKDDHWLTENLPRLQKEAQAHFRQGESIDDLIQCLIYVMPQLLDRDEVKPWGKILEQAYLRTPYAQYNGLDGIHTLDTTDVYIFQKRPKIPQLPTKTVRRKRVIVHPTQMLEMYVILFMARYYRSADEIEPGQLTDLLRFAHIVGDSYLNNKTHTALAFLYAQMHQPEQAINHAEIAWSYWFNERNAVESGLTAYALASALHQQDRISEAMYWFDQSAAEFGKTPHKNVYFMVELTAAALRLQTAATDKETKQVNQSVNVTLKQLSLQVNSRVQAQQVLTHLQDLLAEGNGKMGHVTDRLRDIAEN